MLGTAAMQRARSPSFFGITYAANKIGLSTFLEFCVPGLVMFVFLKMWISFDFLFSQEIVWYLFDTRRGHGHHKIYLGQPSVKSNISQAPRKSINATSNQLAGFLCSFPWSDWLYHTKNINFLATILSNRSFKLALHGWEHSQNFIPLISSFLHKAFVSPSA